MVYRHIPNFYLQHDQEFAVLYLEWVPLSPLAQLRTSAAQLLELLQTLAVRRLLLDMNSLPDRPLADQQWLGEHWMPGLLALDLEQLVLVIDSQQVHNRLAINALHEPVQPAIRCTSHYFSDPASALDYLTEGSPRRPTQRSFLLEARN